MRVVLYVCKVFGKCGKWEGKGSTRCVCVKYVCRAFMRRTYVTVHVCLGGGECADGIRDLDMA